MAKDPCIKKIILIPAWNEGDNIAGILREVRESAPDYDFIVINDCSTDNTAAICRENKAPLIDLAEHVGIGGAMQKGYLFAYRKGYDFAVQIDGDGQHDPAFLGKLYEAMIREQADMAIGSRFIENTGYHSSALRRWGIGYFSGLIRLITGKRIYDPTSGMRMISREVIELFARNYPGDYPEPDTLVRLLKKERKVIEVPVRMRKRFGGRSSIRAVNGVYYMFKVTLAVILEKIKRD